MSKEIGKILASLNQGQPSDTEKKKDWNWLCDYINDGIEEEELSDLDDEEDENIDEDCESCDEDPVVDKVQSWKEKLVDAREAIETTVDSPPISHSNQMDRPTCTTPDSEHGVITLSEELQLTPHTPDVFPNEPPPMISTPTETSSAECVITLSEELQLTPHTPDVFPNEPPPMISTPTETSSAECVITLSEELQLTPHTPDVFPNEPPPMISTPTETSSAECDSHMMSMEERILSSTPTHIPARAVQKRRRLYSNTPVKAPRDVLTVGDLEKAFSSVRLKTPVKQRVHPDAVIEELGLIFPSDAEKSRVKIKIRNYMDKKRKTRSKPYSPTSRFLGLSDGVLNITAVTRKLDGEPAEESGSAAKRPCDTPAMPTETPSPSPTSSLTSHFVGITRTGWDTLEKSSLTRRKQKIAGKLVDAVKEVADSSEGRLTLKQILDEVVNQGLPGFEIVEKRPSLNPMATLIE